VTVTNPVVAGSLSASLASGFTVNAPQPTVTSTAFQFGDVWDYPQLADQCLWFELRRRGEITVGPSGRR
jgi:hypothetical protein